MRQNEIILGDCRDTMRRLIAEGVKVQCIVTSPPYWGLRDYGVAGQLGLEPTLTEFLANMCEVFDLCRDLLADDGTLWLNMGDSYAANRGFQPVPINTRNKSGHVGGQRVTNIANLLNRRLEGHILFYGGTDPRACAAQRINVLLYDKGAPVHEFQTFLRAKRVCIKQGEHNFGQIGGALDAPVHCWLSGSLSGRLPKNSDAELILDVGEDIGIIVAAGNLDADSALRDAIALAIKHGKAAFAIEIPAEPGTEGVAGGVTTRDAITLNALLESSMKVDAVDNPVPLGDRANSRARQLCNFSVCVASEEQCTLALHGGAQLSFIGVGHLYRLGADLISYSSLRQEAVREWNATRPKQELGQPHLLTRALMESGWINRQTIIWHKPNPMPESVRDRCTKAHEYLFLLTKSERYFYDFDAMQEPVSGGAHARGAGVNPKAAPSGWDTSPGGHRNLTGRYPGTGVGFGRGYDKVAKPRVKQNTSFSAAVKDLVDTRNRRSVWTIPTQSFDGAHFATFPEALVEPCVLAGSRPGDIVFDPFMGSGTVAQVAGRLGRHYLGCELNPEYFALQRDRTRQPGLQLETA